MSGYKDDVDVKLTLEQQHALEQMKRVHRQGPRNRHEKRAFETKLKKRMKARAKSVHTAIRTGRAV